MVKRRLAWLCLGLLLIAGLAAGQAFYGAIIGTVMDETGAVIPGATVTVIHLGTGEEKVQQADATGLFRFTNLLPADYRLEVEQAGFKRFVREPITVQVEQSVRVDASLQLGDVTEVVEVTAQSPLLQSQTSSMGQVVAERKVLETPLNGRNVLNLTALVPSVVPQGGAMRNPTGTNIFAWGNYQIGGGMANQNATTIDGAPINVSYINLTTLVPTQDAIQEFKVQTNNLTAEFGRFAGGVINLTTKAGSNEWHGSAYEFLRNKELNANTFFNNANGVERPAFVQNQFGANAGGPIIKNKLFVFGGWEGFYERRGDSFLLTVPSNALRAGDFSDRRDADGNLVPIFDPLTANNADELPRDPFPNNQIPADRIDPAAREMIRLFGEPTGPGEQFTEVNNFAANANIGGDNRQVNVRSDWNVGPNHRMFGRFTHWNNDSLAIDPFGTGITVDRGPEDFTTINAVFADTLTLSPTTVFDIRLSYLRFRYNRDPVTLGTPPSQFGLPSFLDGQVAFQTVPTPCIQGFADPFCSQGTGSTIVARNENYSILPSMTKISGRHELKFGADVRRLTHNYAQSNTPSGIFNFDRNFTADDPFNPVGGDGFASFLLGFGTGGGFNTPGLVAGQQIYQGYFINDRWQVSNKLTVNLGFRWEVLGPWSERFDRLTVFQPDGENAELAGVQGVSTTGRLALVNSEFRESRNSFDTGENTVAPRVGFAYRLTNNTVLRGGYGIFWLPNDVAFSTAPNQDSLNTFNTPWVASLDGGITPFNPLSNPAPDGIVPPPGRDPEFLQTLLGQSVLSGIPDQDKAYTQQWNFNIQHQLPDGTKLDLAYAGAKGVHLPINVQTINQLPDEFLSLGEALQEQVPNPFFGVITTESVLSQPTVARGQLLRPFPQFTDVVRTSPTNRNSIYHSFQLKAEKRLKNGGNILASYTASKLISDTDTLTGWLDGGIGQAQGWATNGNNNNLMDQRAIANFDVAQRFVVSYVLDLPFGKGRKFGRNASGVAGVLISGWGVNGVTTFQTGVPLALSTTQNTSNSFGGSQRPDNNGQSAELSGDAQDRLTQFFDTSVFSQPAAFTFGNTPRTLPDVRTDHMANFDFAVFKRTPITETANIEFRAEFFNLFNRTQFASPGTTLGTPQFGVISSQLNNPRQVQFALRFNF